jgi:hypothetical protein
MAKVRQDKGTLENSLAIHHLFPHLGNAGGTFTNKLHQPTDQLIRLIGRTNHANLLQNLDSLPHRHGKKIGLQRKNLDNPTEVMDYPTKQTTDGSIHTLSKISLFPLGGQCVITVFHHYTKPIFQQPIHSKFTYIQPTKKTNEKPDSRSVINSSILAIDNCFMYNNLRLFQAGVSKTVDNSVFF